MYVDVDRYETIIARKNRMSAKLYIQPVTVTAQHRSALQHRNRPTRTEPITSIDMQSVATLHFTDLILTFLCGGGCVSY